jgi:hypothetical protein
VERRKLHPDPVRLGQSPGQLLERDVRLCPNDLQQERLVRGELARRPHRAALRLGRNMALPPLGRRQPHRRAGRDPKHPRRRPAGPPRLYMGQDALA